MNFMLAVCAVVCGWLFTYQDLDLRYMYVCTRLLLDRCNMSSERMLSSCIRLVSDSAKSPLY